MAHRVTMGDVAQRANASITTVSLVLRDRPGIGEETRQRVLAVARDLGYQRRTPATGRTAVRNVAMILRSRSRSSSDPVPSVNRFYNDVINGIEAAARDRRMNLLYATLPVDDDNIPRAVPEHLLQQSLSGILLIGSFRPETVERIASARTTPIVLVDAPAGVHALDAVSSDNRGGARTATRHLIDHGHRHIAAISPRPDVDANFFQRLEGYRAALDEHGLTQYHITIQQFQLHGVADATTTFLHDHPQVTGIIGCNDAVAIEAMRGASRTGRRIPDDLSLIGFDDIQDARVTTPALTTMAVDRPTMGRQAVALLDDRLTWPDSCRMTTILRPDLRPRGSVGPAPEPATSHPG